MEISHKVSVIVPVYNAEKWLHRCVDSILAQTYTNFELLLVDDGSTDNSGKICDDYVCRDQRVKAFHKYNGGVSSARNYGIDNAVGEYIAFVDADDWIASQHFEDLLKDINADLRVNSYHPNENKEKWKCDLPDQIYIGHEKVSQCVLTYFSNNFRTVWCKRFNADIIKSYNIRFNSDISMGEDLIFVLEYLCYVKSISLSSYIGIFYDRSNETSLSKLTNNSIPALFMSEVSNKITKLESNLGCSLRPLLLKLIENDFKLGLQRIVESDKSFRVQISEIREFSASVASKNIVNDTVIIPKGKYLRIRDFLLRHQLYISALVLFKLFKRY